MAEAAGLVVGTVALIGTFKDCIDVYGMIVAARALTDDAEVLNTKLDVERMLLLQWADRIGLTRPEQYDRRLDDPDLNRTISRVLGSIKGLLSDGKALRDRYGLVEYHGVSHTIALDNRSETTAGSTRLQNFMTQFERLSIHTAKPRREHSTATRFKWVVRDKEKFARLMDELSYFVSQLNALTPASEQSFRTMTKQDLAQIRGITQLRAIFKASIGSQPQIALIAQQMILQWRILDRLWFRWMDERKANIADRHFRTLDWALDAPEGQRKWDNLAQWLLKNGSGLYWLAGKPGSGKSTLMKYLSDHPRATCLLKEWAGQSELVISQFFFYALGMLEQKSQDGLLRSLLYQILDQYRDPIEQILPAMWKEATFTENTDHELAMPSLSEMQTALLQLVGKALADKKFWILIDGLDEFEGKHVTIATFISRLEQLPNVKIIVSSRPLPVFVSRFEHAPKMYLQDLTNRDIVTYIYDTIKHHPLMAQIAHLEQGIATKISRILIGKASGVFLWVVLACRSILEGLEDYETVPELMGRITELPSELDDFFRRIVSGVDNRKRDKCARLLRLVFESQSSDDVRLMPAIGLAIVDEQGLRADYMGPSATGLSDEQLVQRCHLLEGRLRGRCSGLVELQTSAFDTNYIGSVGERRMPLAAKDAALINSRVIFIHRSLYEFLCTEGMWEWDALRVDDGCGRFEPHLVLASLWTQLAGLEVFNEDHFKNECLENALVHNAQAEATKCPPRLLATSLSRLECIFPGDEKAHYTFAYLAGFCIPHQSKSQKNHESLSGGLAFAAELGMVSLIHFALEEPDELRRALIPPERERDVQKSSVFSIRSRGLYKLNMDCAGSHTNRPTIFPLLYHATCKPLLAMLRLDRRNSLWGRMTSASTAAVEHLLRGGHDPNEGFFVERLRPSTTVWKEWLLMVSLDGKELGYSAEWAYQRAATALLFVNAGADVGAPGTDMCNMVDESLSRFISDAVQRSGRVSVEVARSDALWLKVRDRIQSLRTAASQQDAQSC